MQLSFTDMEYANRKVITPKEKFLDAMDKIIPWEEWIGIIKQYYYEGKRGRKPKDIETMLRMLLLQVWYNLSDEGVEYAIYDSYAMRRFMKLDFTTEQVPDATTLLKFRHILEKQKIGRKLFEDIKQRLEVSGLMMRGGSILDATIIEAATSTKNKEGERDKEMHQTKKGNQWHFGMKVHVGADAGSGYVHDITGTAANVHDITEAHKLIREDDKVIYGDSAYNSLDKREEMQDKTQIEYKTNQRPKSVKTDIDRQIENRKSSVRCKVEHPFQIIKVIFGYVKTAYKGIAKNMNRLYLLFGSANLLMCIRANRTEEFCKCIV